MNQQNSLSDQLLCQLAQGGDLHAEEQLLLRYRQLVSGHSHSYFLMGGDMEDLLQEGTIGLLKAIRYYDPGRGASFYTFANACIRHALLSAVQSAGRQKQLPLNQSLSLDSDDTGGDALLSLYSTGEHTTFNPEELLILQEELQERLALLSCGLSGLEQQVIDLYLKGYSYTEIAQRLHRPIKSVDNAVQRVRKKLSPSPKKSCT